MSVETSVQISSKNWTDSYIKWKRQSLVFYCSNKKRELLSNKNLWPEFPLCKCKFEICMFERYNLDDTSYDIYFCVNPNKTQFVKLIRAFTGSNLYWTFKPQQNSMFNLFKMDKLFIISKNCFIYFTRKSIRSPNRNKAKGNRHYSRLIRHNTKPSPKY